MGVAYLFDAHFNHVLMLAIHLMFCLEMGEAR